MRYIELKGTEANHLSSPSVATRIKRIIDALGGKPFRLGRKKYISLQQTGFTILHTSPYEITSSYLALFTLTQHLSVLYSLSEVQGRSEAHILMYR